LDTIKIVTNAEAESKKEKAKYDSDETVSAEEMDFNVSNPMIQIDPSESKTEPKLTWICNVLTILVNLSAFFV